MIIKRGYYYILRSIVVFYACVLPHQCLGATDYSPFESILRRFAILHYPNNIQTVLNFKYNGTKKELVVNKRQDLCGNVMFEYFKPDGELGDKIAGLALSRSMPMGLNIDGNGAILSDNYVERGLRLKFIWSSSGHGCCTLVVCGLKSGTLVIKYTDFETSEPRYFELKRMVFELLGVININNTVPVDFVVAKHMAEKPSGNWKMD